MELSKYSPIFAAEKEKQRPMCKYNISIDDAVMEAVRPSITKGMNEATWVQHQVEMLFSKLAQKNSPVNHSLRLSQRLRGIGHAPKDFDYKKELEERF